MKIDEEETTKTSLVIIGNGWVSRKCYQPAAQKTGITDVQVIDADDRHVIGHKLSALPNLLRGKRWLFVIAVPNHSHLDVLQLVKGRGVILCEKPLVRPDEAGHEFLAKADLSAVFVSSPNRFRADVRQVLDIVAGGHIGQIRKIKAVWRRRQGIPRPGSWYTSRNLAGGGALVDLGPHVLDIGLKLLNFPDMKVTGAELKYAHLMKAMGSAGKWMEPQPGDVNEMDVETGARFSLLSPIGQLFEGYVEWAGDVRQDETIFQVTGSRGEVTLTSLFGYAPSSRNYADLRITGLKENQENQQLYIPLARDPALDFGHMIRSVLRNEDRCATGTEGQKVMHLIRQIYDVAAL